MQNTKDLYYDKKGSLISHRRWRQLLLAPDYHCIAKTFSISGHMISTIWIGEPQGCDVNGRPLIFETVVIPNDKMEFSRRKSYATQVQAIEGHIEIASEWRRK